jgi:hypothetical protein
VILMSVDACNYHSVCLLVSLVVCLSASPSFTWWADWLRASGAALKRDPMTRSSLQPRESYCWNRASTATTTETWTFQATDR